MAGVTYIGATCEGVDFWVTYEQRCDTQPPDTPCAHPKSALKASYCRGDEIEYMTIVTNVTFIGALCEYIDTWKTNEPPITKDVSPVFSYGDKCYYIPIDTNTKSDWLSAETYCSETTNGSIALPESQDFLNMVNDNALLAGTHNKLWFGPNIMGENYKCVQEACLAFWKYPHNGTQIPADLFLNGVPSHDKKRLCLFLEVNKDRKIENENCGKSDRIPLCEVNAVFTYTQECASGIDIQMENRSYTYEYDHAGPKFPRGTIANVTCTIENDTPKCQRSFQAECGGLYGWFFQIGNMSHLEFCEPCRECPSPPDPRSCTRFKDPNAQSLPYSHGDTVYYEVLGTSGSASVLIMNTTCIDGEWEFLAIPQECQTPPNEKICNSTLFVNNTLAFLGDPPYEVGTTAELICSLGTVRAECLGEPHGWFFHNDSLENCGICEPGDCVFPPPNTPCGIPIGDIHPAPFKEGEGVNYTCPVPGKEAQVTCENGTWVGGCEQDPNIFAIGDECYVTLPQKDTIENQAVFCNNLSQGYLAPARSFPSEMIDILTNILGPADSLFLGTHLTSNPEAYTCEPQKCESLWLDEKNRTLQVIHKGANKCLVLEQDGLATYQCQGQAFALCRVFTGIENAKALFGFEDHCYSISKSSDSLEDATMKCEREFNGYVSPAISSQEFIELVEEKYNGMNMTGSIIFSTHLTYNESAYTCPNGSACNLLWTNEHGDKLASVETVPGTDPNKCLILDMRNRTYKNQECVSPWRYICRVQPPDANFGE
ncbi:unnamed protein product [Cyprideis torosa]|uniref:Uncharacterized protein n=1 Tax=Cyprideis torosa TaxID=163714 RepID=A0A7R8WJV3_9CRUS|nr:unnamed protein product [Cyprideis torosa]CAG0896148.1 unnamed protein product [Cyprideis torosa]